MEQKTPYISPCADVPLIQHSTRHRTGAAVLRLNFPQAFTGLDRCQQGTAVRHSSTTGRACSGRRRRSRSCRGRRRRRTGRSWGRRRWRWSTSRRRTWRGRRRRRRRGRCLKSTICLRSSWRRGWRWRRRRGRRAILDGGSGFRRRLVVHGAQRSRRSHGTEQYTGKLLRAATTRMVVLVRRIII